MVWHGAVAGFAGWAAGRVLKAAVSRQREYLADARAVQWTRSRDGLGGVLRKVMTQRTDADAAPRRFMGIDHPSVQHMLLVDVPNERVLAHWMDSHPTLDQRVRRLYGRRMSPLPLIPDDSANQPDQAAQARPMRQATEGPFTLV